MPRYGHMFNVAFSLDSDHPEADDVTPAMLRAALVSRIDDLDEDAEWLHACGLCGTFEYDDEGQGTHVTKKG